MRFRRFTSSLAAGVLVFGFCLLSAGIPQAAAKASAPQRSALLVVKNYFSLLDSDLKMADFSNLGTAYAANATLKVLDANGEPDEYHGIAGIIHYWKERIGQVPGLQFKADSIVSLDTLHVAAFERTTNNLHITLAGRCAHLFKIIRGKVVFDVYFPVAFTKAELALKE
jgi:hypothetical protein